MRIVWGRCGGGCLRRRAGDFRRDDRPAAGAARGVGAAILRCGARTIARHTQADDGTEKLLLTLADGGQIECVLLRENDADRGLAHCAARRIAVAPDDLHQHAGRLRHGLRVLRQRPGGRRLAISRPARSSSRCCGCSCLLGPTSG